MGFRTTGVRLVANVQQYVRELGRGQRATEKFNDGLDESRLKGARMANSLAETGKRSRAELDKMVDSVKKLDKEIQSTERTIMRAARSYSSTGNNDFLKQIREEQNKSKVLKDIRNLLPDPRVMDEAGRSWGRRFVDAFGQQLEVRFASAAAPAILAMVPFLSATIAGAVVGAAGMGGVVGGVVLATRDPRVAGAGKDLGVYIMKDLETRASRFVEPVLRGIGRVRSEWDKMGPDLNRIFKADRFLEPLIDGIAKFARNLNKGLADAIDQADGPIQGFRNMFAQTGLALGGFFTTMSEHADIGTIALNEFTMALSNTLNMVTGFLSGAASMYEFANSLDTVIDKFRYWVEDNNSFADLGYGLDLTADGFKKGTKEANAYRQATLGTATAMDFAVLKQAGMTDAQIAAIDSTGKYTGAMDAATAATSEAGIRAATLKAAEEQLKSAQQDLTIAQNVFNGSLDRLNPNLQASKMLMDALTKAATNLYGAAITGSEANEKYEQSWDNLTSAVSDNGNSLAITEKKGRANRDSLEELLIANNEVYYANIGMGMSLDKARDKHVRNTNAIIAHANKLGLDKTATQALITTYGKIPPQRVTELIATGLSEIKDAMTRVYIAQRAMAEGKTVGQVRYEGSAAMRSLLYADGGYTGPGHKYQPAGIVHAGEYVIKKESTAKIQATNPGLLDEMNATGQTTGYAKGGLVFPVEQRKFPIRTNMSHTFVMSMAAALAKVAPNFGDWPSSPGAQRGDSGVWRKVVALIKGTGPMSGSFGNGYRPGDPKWHGSGRAVDWMGYNQDGLASFLSRKRPLELIHRTNHRDYAYTRGVNKGSFNNSLMEAHRNHVHIAMQNGGVIREPVMGMGASGRTYSFGEAGPERVLSNAQSQTYGMAVTVNNYGAITMPQFEDLIVKTIQKANSRGRKV